jgi:hypothetical protein
MIELSIPEFKFHWREKRSKREMLEKVVTLPLELQDKVCTLAREKRMEILFSKPDSTIQDDSIMGADECGVLEEHECDEDLFLKVVNETVVHQCISEFIDTTGNEAVRQHVCMVCAREMWSREVEQYAVDNIPNKQCLLPADFHPAHKLTFGMLLETAVMQKIHGRLYGDICHDCSRTLNDNKAPTLSLANGMWIGDVPLELAVLTLPEKILVAKFFPAAYVVKLFPKQKGATHWLLAGLNSGVKGNMSTYKLNTEDIVDMVDPKIMPPPAKILASVIGVTIIGPRNIPERTMLGYFRVRRNCIRDALKWLQTHNPLYADIQISEPRLEELPDNGVPNEIMESAQHSDEVEHLWRSMAGYVDEEEGVVDDMDATRCVEGV